MRIAILAIGAGLLFSTAALAGPAQQAAPTQTAATSTKEVLVCRPMYHEGMLLARATQCHTQNWWDMNRYRQEQELRDIQQRGDLQR